MSTTTIRTIQPAEKKAIIASFEKIIKTQRDYEETMQQQMEADYYAQMQHQEPPIDEPENQIEKT